jgi:hypothetical protein
MLVLHVEGSLRDAPPHKKKVGEVPAGWLTKGRRSVMERHGAAALQ